MNTETSPTTNSMNLSFRDCGRLTGLFIAALLGCLAANSQAQTPTPTPCIFPGETPSPTPTPDCATTPSPTPAPTGSPMACETASPTASPTPFPDIDPTATPIPSAFQPPDRPSDFLTWRIYTPSPSPSTTPPGVIVIHGGGFKGGSAFDDLDIQACLDLAAAGFYVVSVNYELAPCGLIPGQPPHTDYTSGRPPNQSDDIKAFVRALRADNTHCNGKIGVVGGSAGGTHAVWVALDARDTRTVWPYWNGSTDRVDSAVSLSGAYQFDDRTEESYSDLVLEKFDSDIVNYTHTGDLSEQKNLSPVSLVRTLTQRKPFKPLFLINSIEDQGMPYHQIVDMICRLRRKGVPDTAYQTLTISGNLHSFNYWCQDAGDGETVGTKVIKFLNCQLRQQCD